MTNSSAKMNMNDSFGEDEYGPQTLLLALDRFLTSDGIRADLWNLRVVALVSMVSLWAIHNLSPKKRGVKGTRDWASLIHASITGYGSWLCLQASTLPAEPMFSVTCHGPATVVHKLIPAISWGWGTFELYNSLRSGTIEFVSGF